MTSATVARPSREALRTEFTFVLPRGYVDENGVVHKEGTMRLATARDEILPQRDPRVRDNEAYLTVILLSRVLPRRIGPRPDTGGRDLAAFTRLIVAWSLCEAAALFPLVARMLTHDERMLAFCALDVVALATLFPGEDRWAAMASPVVGGGSPGRMVR